MSMNPYPNPHYAIRYAPTDEPAGSMDWVMEWADDNLNTRVTFFKTKQEALEWIAQNGDGYARFEIVEVYR